MKIVLESPVFTLEAALKATVFGVDRLELCSSFPEGGETPGAGMLAYLKEKIDIPVFVMIRPPGGDFIYSSEEVEVMKKEIEILRSHGADGFVFGVLRKNGSVNEKACKKLVQAAGENPCTFHRAFDVCYDRENALEKIIECGFSRILTSGGKKSVSEGLDTIIRLLELADNRVIIMPGGGMQPELVVPLKKTGFLREVHASCKTFRNSARLKRDNEPEGVHNQFESDGIVTISRRKVEEFKAEF